MSNIELIYDYLYFFIFIFLAGLTLLVLFFHVVLLLFFIFFKNIYVEDMVDVIKVFVFFLVIIKDSKKNECKG
jgi:hypothetical protein